MEEQIESAQSDRTAQKKTESEPESPDARRRKESLLLARKRVLDQLKSSTDARYHEMMDRALADLDRLLAEVH